jgi:hypothetical protein
VVSVSAPNTSLLRWRVEKFCRFFLDLEAVDFLGFFVSLDLEAVDFFVGLTSLKFVCPFC